MTLVELQDEHEELDRLGLLPADRRCVFVGGSLARGWQHHRSDADAYVVSTARRVERVDGANPVRLDPGTVPHAVATVRGRRWEIRYWQQCQVDQLLDKVSWSRFEAGSRGFELSLPESVMLTRVPHALVLHGEDWMARHRDRLAASAFRAMVTTRALDDAEGAVEDALGMLESGDTKAAVISAQLAFQAAVQALLASLGETAQQTKWQARQLAAVDPAQLPVDRYWSTMTMRTYDPAAPAEWVRETLQSVRDITGSVKV
jgi:hypothetical protein